MLAKNGSTLWTTTTTTRKMLSNGFYANETMYRERENRKFLFYLVRSIIPTHSKGEKKNGTPKTFSHRDTRG